MMMTRILLIALTVCLGYNSESSLVWGGSDVAQAGSTIKIEGVVVDRNGIEVLVRDFRGRQTEIQLQRETRFEEERKNFLRDPLLYSSADVVRGLKVKVKGQLLSSGVVLAEKVRFTQDDLKVARMVESNLLQVDGEVDRLDEADTFLAGQIEELGDESTRNRNLASAAMAKADQAMAATDSQLRMIRGVDRRVDLLDHNFSQLDDFETAAVIVIHFAAGSATLENEALAQLDDVAGKFGESSAVLFEVAGFASADGDEHYNRRLSERRASEVINYLIAHKNVPARSFVVPQGYGELLPVSDNKTVEGRRQNRRAEVRVLLNKGLAALSQAPNRPNSSP